MPAAKSFTKAGLKLAATSGTAAFLRAHGVTVDIEVAKLTEVLSGEATGVSALDLIRGNGVQFMINTPREGRRDSTDGAEIRRAATIAKVPVVTTVAAAVAAGMGVEELTRGGVRKAFAVKSLQEHLGMTTHTGN